MPTISTNDTTLYYLQDGEGEDVVLLHGLASNLAFWYSGVMVPLRRQYRVTAYDLRGHGKSAMPAGGYSHHAMAQDLSGLVDALQIEKFHLVGHSYGGLVSITYALAHPDRLLSLTLADVPVDETITAERLIKEGPVNKYPELEMLEVLAKKPVNTDTPRNSFIPFHQGKGAGKTAKLWLKLLETTSARQDFHTRKISLQDLQQLQIPALLTYGFNSGWKKSGEFLKKHLPDTNVMYIHNAGHAHPWEKPGFFLQCWLDFVHPLGQRPSPDRRHNLRYAVGLLLELHTEDGRSCTVTTTDISSTGILINSAEDCQPGSSVRLIQKNGSLEPAISGRVIRRDHSADTYQLAIHFDAVPGNDQFLGSVQESINSRVLSRSTEAPGIHP